MRIFVLASSIRKNANSFQVAKITQSIITDRLAQVASVYSLHQSPLATWSEERTPTDQQHLENVTADIKRSDGLIIVVPEWNGSLPGSVLNFFLHFGPETLAHKPVLIVAVSVGLGGSYPVSELRSAGYKNTRMLYLPEHVIVRQVNEFLDNHRAGHPDYTYTRLVHACELLIAYTEAMQPVVSRQPFDFKTYPNGM